MLEAFEAFTADGYLPPILIEHTPDGSTYGVIRALEAREGEGIFGDIEFAKGVKQRVEDGLHRNLSPSHYSTFKHPHTGKTYYNVLREVSLVSVPHLKNLEPLGGYYTMSESGLVTSTASRKESNMADGTPSTPPVDNEENNTPTTEQRLDAMESNIAKLTDLVQSLSSNKEGAGGDDGDDDGKSPPAPAQNSEPESPTVVALKEQVGHLTVKLSEERRERKAAELKRELPGQTDERYKHLLDLSETSPALFKETVAVLKKPAAAPERGSTGNAAPTTTPSKLVTLCEQAKKEDVAFGGALLGYLERKGFDLAEYDTDEALRVYKG